MCIYISLYPSDTASKLDMLVGEIEDAVSSAVTTKMKKQSLSSKSNVRILYI